LSLFVAFYVRFKNDVDASSSWYPHMVKTVCFPVVGKLQDYLEENFNYMSFAHVMDHS
jgi:hypothetical protein